MKNQPSQKPISIIGLLLIFIACEAPLKEPSSSSLLYVSGTDSTLEGFHGPVPWGQRLAPLFTVTKGEVHQVGTTHTIELGKKLVGERAAITTSLGRLRYPLLVSLRANVDDQVALSLVLEFFTIAYDGSPDLPDPISGIEVRGIYQGALPDISVRSIDYLLRQEATIVSPLGQMMVPEGQKVFPTEQKKWPITTDDYSPQEIYIDQWPAWAETTTLSILKEGAGNAIVLRIALREIANSESDEGRGPDCDSDNPCPIGYCEKTNGDLGQCVMCLEDAHCPGEGLCFLDIVEPAYDDEWSPINDMVMPSLDFTHNVCVPPGKSLGAPCMRNTDCATSICCEKVCSSCCEQTDCAGDQTCQKSTTLKPMKSDFPIPDNSTTGNLLANIPLFNELPFQCAPGQGLAQQGDHCLIDDDCISGKCSGDETITLKVESSAECAFTSDSEAATQDEDTSCFITGVTNGHCTL